MIYRDLKPENVILDQNGNVKLTDFGIAKKGVKGMKKSYTFCGTNEYIAPEFLLGNKGHNKAVDWWCLGIMVYELLSGESPFAGVDFKNRQHLFQAILKMEFTRKEEFSDDAWSLISGLLNRDAALRLGCGPFGASEIFSHPFYSSIEWGKLIRKELHPPFDPEIQEVEKDFAKYIEEDFLDQSVSSVDVEALEGSEIPHASVGVNS